MPVVNVTSNRDVPESTHMNVTVGNGMQLSFFDFPHVPRLQRRAPEGVGGVMHIALGISKERLAEVKGHLDQHRVKYQEVGGSLYVKDPNGLGIELMPTA
jgi:catechol-2,3-dioxygenase